MSAVKSINDFPEHQNLVTVKTLEGRFERLGVDCKRDGNRLTFAFLANGDNLSVECVIINVVTPLESNAAVINAAEARSDKVRLQSLQEEIKLHQKRMSEAVDEIATLKAENVMLRAAKEPTVKLTKRSLDELKCIASDMTDFVRSIDTLA